MSRVRLGLIACALSAVVSATSAGTISIDTISGPSRDLPFQARAVRLTGVIDEGDAETLRRILTQLRAAQRAPATLLMIELSSRGGDLYEGIRLGNLIHQFRAATVVRRGDICLSACALAFLGGATETEQTVVANRNLEIGGKLGFHAFSLNPSVITSADQDRRDDGAIIAFNRARGAASSVISYTARMGIDPDFIARMLGRPPEEIEYIDTVEQFITLAVCPLSIGRPDVSMGTQAVNVSNNLTSLASVADSLRATPILANRIRRYLLEIVQASMMSLRVKGPLSDQLASYSVMRNDRATENLYDDLRAAGLALPEIVGPTFEVSGYRAGIYDLRTIVSLSADDPDRYDLVTLGPKGIAPPSRAAPPNCRRLFLYDRGERLNP